MHILLASAYFLPHVGGVERFTETLARGLAARGHDVVVVCCRTDRQSPGVEEADGFRIERVPATNWLERQLGVPYVLPDPVSFTRWLDRRLNTFDVLHASEARYPATALALHRARAASVPSVLTQHTGFVPQRNGALDAAQRMLGKSAGPVARMATVVTVLNPNVGAWVTGDWRVREVELLPVGVSAREVGADRAQFGLPDDRVLALFVGRNVPTKGFDLLAAATDEAYEIVAITDAEPAARPGLRILPFMTGEELATLMASVDAFVLPSRGEGLPLSLQEAMTAGLPVVTTMLPGYEHFFGGDDVLVVEPQAASIREGLRRLATDPALRARLSARSRAVAGRHFSEDRFVEAYERLYERLCSR